MKNGTTRFDQMRVAEVKSIMHSRKLSSEARPIAVQKPDGTPTDPRKEAKDWRALYEAAILELDRTALATRIETASLAIREEIDATDRVGDREKWIALNEALHTLRVLTSLYAGQ